MPKRHKSDVKNAEAKSNAQGRARHELDAFSHVAHEPSRAASQEILNLDNPLVANVLEILLRDQTRAAAFAQRSKGNPTPVAQSYIIWGTDVYAANGSNFAPGEPMTPQRARELLKSQELRPRAFKNAQEQSKRVRSHAEVFTPTHVCRRMNDFLDAVWLNDLKRFDYQDDATHSDVVETLLTQMSEKAKSAPSTKKKSDRISPSKRNKSNDEAEPWQDYVRARVLEITCGEAPFIVQRYDAATGKPLPTWKRRGMLDRKLLVIQRVIAQHFDNSEEEWFKWVLIAFQSVYGYEYQGDNLLIARLNLFLTFLDFYEAQEFCADDSKSLVPPEKICQQIAEAISWNFWQMDGLTLKMPDPTRLPWDIARGAVTDVETSQDQCVDKDVKKGQALLGFMPNPCAKRKDRPKDSERLKVKKWLDDKSIHYFVDRIHKKGSQMKFDFIIGNPPYQVKTPGNARMSPVYHLFMQLAYSLGDKVLLITPARFLSNAGATPEKWNREMLNDPHLRVIHTEEKSEDLFPGITIKGGVAITYHDTTSKRGSIGTFFPYDEMKSIYKKVVCDKSFHPLSDLVFNWNRYNFNVLDVEHPELEHLFITDGGTKQPQVKTNAFTIIPIFTNGGGVTIVLSLSV